MSHNKSLAALVDNNRVGIWLMNEEENMKRRRNRWFQGAALLLIAVTLLLVPGAGAQSKYTRIRDSGTILRGRLIDLDAAALTAGYPDIVDLNCPTSQSELQ
jgi:hypothetical protein